jgi:hypothetical protein
MDQRRNSWGIPTSSTIYMEPEKIRPERSPSIHDSEKQARQEHEAASKPTNWDICADALWISDSHILAQCEKQTRYKFAYLVPRCAECDFVQ